MKVARLKPQRSLRLCSVFSHKHSQQLSDNTFSIRLWEPWSLRQSMGLHLIRWVCALGKFYACVKLSLGVLSQWTSAPALTCATRLCVRGGDHESLDANAASTDSAKLRSLGWSISQNLCLQHWHPSFQCLHHVHTVLLHKLKLPVTPLQHWV